MSNANQFMLSLQTSVTRIIDNFEDANTLQDRLAQDATLAAAAAASPLGVSLGLTATDVNNAASAINQLLFAFNSGAPPQKSFFYKLL
jgi:hypothetical protein